MNLYSIPVKTPQGVAEVGQRHLRLSQRHRTVLFLVDGRRNLAEVQRMAVAAGASVDLLDELLQLGLVALSGEPAGAIAMVSEPAGGAVSDSIEPSVLLGPLDIPLDDSVMSAGPVLVGNSVAHAVPDIPVLHAVVKERPSFGARADDVLTHSEDPVEQARAMLIRAVKEEAPVTGSLTLMRLKRAKTAEGLAALLDEVELRISKPNRSLVAQQLLSNVRQLLILASSR